MTRPRPLAQAQDINLPPRVTRVTRSTSQLQKELVPTSEDQEMQDEIVLAPLPSGTSTSQSQDQLSSSQTREEAAGNDLDANGLSRLDQQGTTKQSETADHFDGSWKLNGTENEKASKEEGEDNRIELDEDDYQYDEEEEVENSDISDQDGPRSESETRQIEDEMEQLEQNVPEILNKYKLVDRLGEGTFSSVYKAIDVQHSRFDNSQWQPTAPTGKVYVALKRIYVTSSPVRIHNELEILHDLRGAANVAYLIDAIRHEDQVLAVMPYNRHQDFRNYYRKATLPMLRSYFSCLFRALAATHQLQIIHRDVKPANFLYDMYTGTGVLCDYGLAQKIGGDEFYEWRSGCLHSLPGPSLGGREARRAANRKLEKDTGSLPGLASGLHGVRLAKPHSLWEQTQKMEDDFDQLRWTLTEREDNGEELAEEEIEEVRRMRPWEVPEGWRDDIEGRMMERQAFYKGWRPAKYGSSMAGNRRIGYLKEDRRPSVRANRAGTRGFRAPEVLLKCPDQTVSLDVWSAGIILLCFLTRRFPFFQSNDDTEALAEITAIFGKRKMERCAALHNRTFVTNVPDLENPAHATFHDLVKSLNPPIVVDNSPNPYGPVPSTDEEIAKWYDKSELFLAVDLMKRCLELDCTKRWTAEECLEHPFFAGEYSLGSVRTEHRESGHLPESGLS
ncbi:serine/threonine protein kinase CDC7 [Sporobolomyces salmoneus]|uniref:serine/threonine protein kinase CDC7 n=1 Tax=Sporobolomyces salmoneus TaxID=183962 RepID=UPI00318280CB